MYINLSINDMTPEEKTYFRQNVKAVHYILGKPKDPLIQLAICFGVAFVLPTSPPNSRSVSSEQTTDKHRENSKDTFVEFIEITE